MTHTECVQKNHETGQEYIKLSQKTLELAKKVEAKVKQGVDDPAWDFERLAEHYKYIGSRFEIIGKALISIPMT